MTRPFLDDDAAAGLDTPVVVVDIDRAQARIDRMADAMHDRGVALRPHAKTHKSLEFARRQMAAGAVGLTVATIGEGEVFADGGLEDLFIAYPVIARGPKAERLRRLADRCRLSVGADSAAGLAAIATALRGSSVRLRVVLEIDCGGARTGVPPDAAGSLARRATDLGLDVDGVFTHGGHGGHAFGARVGAADDEVIGLAAAAAGLRAEGIEPRVLSAGSTPTALLSARAPVTEERPGTYIFGDRQQAALADEPFEDAALMVAATVVSFGGSPSGFVVDAGAKILAKDTSSFLSGHGSVLGFPDAIIERVNDHHGVVSLPAGRDRPAIGSVVWVMPNHVCPVVNLVDEYLVASGGRIVGRWGVDARGRNA